MQLSKWHMHRLGLVDFWFYEDEEFLFENGHMLLRGSNGSGKSVTMQSFIPLLLDGNRSSERIDSFGTRSRKMDTYLIDEHSEREDRIGYLYLECKREDSEIYTTIGMGLHARKNKPLDVWYFVIENNMRVNRDFHLIENGLTLSKKQLISILHDQVISSPKEYMKKVNDVLFGFDTIDEYRDFLDLLLKLRAPKLSNSLTPVRIQELLSTSLPPLSDEDLRPMSEAISSMDHLQDELDSLEASLEAASKIEKRYRDYNESILYQKYSSYKEVEKEWKQEKTNIQKMEASITSLSSQLKEIDQTIKDCRAKQEILENEKSSLVDPDIENKHQQYLRLQNELESIQYSCSLKKDKQEEKDNKRIDLENEIFKQENQMASLKMDIKELFEEMDVLYDSFSLSEYILMKQKWQTYPFSDIKKQLMNEKNKTIQVQNEFNVYEQIQHRIQLMEDELSHMQHEMKQYESQLNQEQNAYKEVCKQYQEKFYTYSANNNMIHLSREALNEMTDLLMDYESAKDYFSIQNYVEKEYQKQVSILSKEMNQREFEKLQIQKEYDEVKKEYEIWLNKKEYEPERESYIQKSRNHLRQKNISYIPFYQCIRFSDSMNIEMENKIEEYLRQIHILDALIVNQENKETILQSIEGHDYYLWTTNKIQELEEQEIASIQDLKWIFEKLGIIGNNFFNFYENSIEFGSLWATVDETIPSILIGQTRREKIRKEKIEELKIKIEEKEMELNQCSTKLQELHKKQEMANMEWKAFPNEEILKITLQRVENVEQKISFLQEQMDRKTEKKLQKSQDAAAKYISLKKQCEALLLKIDRESIENRLEDIQFFRDLTNQLEMKRNAMNHCEELLEYKKEDISSILVELDDLNYEIDQLKHRITVCTESMDVVSNLLKDAKFDQKLIRLNEIQKELVECAKQIEVNSKEMGIVEEKINSGQEEKAKKESLYIQLEQAKKEYYEVLVQEYRNHFVFEDDQMDLNLKSLRNDFKKVSDYYASLQSAFYENVQYLSQYNIQHETQDCIHDLKNVDSHLVLHAHYGGKRIPFLELIRLLKNNIETQKLLIVDEDRHIFEDILVSVIGKKIRDKIQMSQKWVSRIEKYMKEMNTSSGLQLSIRWKPKNEVEQGMLSTKELVSLLEKDASMLKESDLKQISNHFRRRIEKVRKLAQDGDEMKSFHQLMKEIMDYRQWFEFVLFGQKTNESRKEMTNKLFYSYSGGEKAIVMYVPLFSAVAAKFEGAREDAPFIMALDEAFAGVDENNIDNMFDLVEKFGFDYIMTSQSLWGDYSTCKALAIYELYRPNNARYITKLSYVWNGFKKKSIYL